jgi:HEAT repeat protein
MKRFFYALVALLAARGLAPAYIDRPPTLGRLVRYDAVDIAVIRVEKVSKEKRIIVYKKVADLKGNYPTDQIRQVVGQRIADVPGPADNPRPRGAHSILDWAEPDKEAVAFHDGNGMLSAICVGQVWYMSRGGKDGLWTVDEFEERALSWAYVGPIDKLRRHVGAILAGKEVVVTAARYDRAGGGPRELWDNQTAYRNLNRDDKVRIWRIRASGDIGSLTDALTSRRDFVVGVGTGDREAVPGLVERLKSADPSARARAAEELGQVGPEGRDAIPTLSVALTDPDGLVRVRAAEALTEVGGDADVADVAAKALGGALADKDVKVRREAAVALWRMGPRAKVAVSALGKALADEDVKVRRDTAATLWRVGPSAKAAVPALAGALKDADREVRCDAAGALGAVGPEAAAAVPPLTHALKDKDLEARHFAARALVRVGDRAAREAAALVLREVLEKGVPDQRLRAELIVLLWKIGPEAAPRPSRLDPGDLHAAAMMLRGVYAAKADQETQRNAVPTLLGAFEAGAKDTVYRVSYAQALGEIGPDAKTAIAALTAALKDNDKSVRSAAAEAIKKIGQR